jgi:hypothetical protein
MICSNHIDAVIQYCLKDLLLIVPGFHGRIPFDEVA